ncbi:MAG TPA: SUMF1/EgtB/PvdO family nonheme iron enzyme [Rhodanobacteraceae bacterium]|nr:SUMF1/EgtB/PvdO family nonheme iron enzyme [Rhodanobacteraceae bacterium]
MADSGDMTTQRILGGSLGVLLLAFALVYRFFPGVLHVEHATPVAGGADVGASSSLGFQPRRAGQVPPTPSAVDAGPPLSLASSEVIMAQRQAPISAELGQWLKQGDAAADAGKLVGSGGAADWYAKVLQADPDNSAARAGVAALARRLASLADNALAHSDLDSASAALDQLRQVPLADAEVVRIDKAINMQAQVAPLLAQAAELLKRGRGLEPKSANALAVYREVIKLDPDNGVARQGLEQIQRVVLDRALAALAENDFKGTDQALAQAADVLADSQALQDTRARVEGMRRQQAEAALDQARSALDAGKLVLAQSLADKALAISPDLPGIDDFDVAMRNAKLYASYRPGQVFSDRFLDRAGTAPAMVVVPTGSFRMGSEDHGPPHEVSIDKGFAMGRSEITVAEFRAFINATGYRTDAERLGGGSIYDERNGRLRDDRSVTWRSNYLGRKADDRDPVLNVSWNDATAYAKWLSQRTGKTYRLPSEAEFEYALRGGSSSRYWWGDTSPAEKVENITGARDRSSRGRRWTHAFSDYGDGYWGPAPAMSFRANPFGLYDIGGNLSEWVEDCWHDNYIRAPRDGSAWVNPGCTTRVLRGGSWGSAPEQVRSAFRQAAVAEDRSARVGFRVVRAL